MRKKYFFYLILLTVVWNGYSASRMTPNNDPTVTTIASQSTIMNVGISNLAFTVADTETLAENLIVSATSTNSDLLPVSNIVFGGTDENRTVSLTPANGFVGSSDVTIIVADSDGGVASTTFTFTVIDAVPTITTVGEQSICMNSSATVSFVVNDNQTIASSLLVEVISSTNVDLLPISSFLVEGANGNKTVRMTPVIGMTGTSEVTVRVKDEDNYITTTTFTVTVTEPSIVAGSEAVQVMNVGTKVVVDADLVINETDNLPNASVSVSNRFEGDVLSFEGTLPDGISQNYNSNSGTLTFTGNMTPADLQSVMRQVQFSTTSLEGEARTIVFSLGSAISNPVNGHFYEYISESTSWTGAKAGAATHTYNGLQGYLATVTSQQENDFLTAKLSGDGWLGGSDDYQQINGAVNFPLYADVEAAEGNFYWITGPEKGQKFSVGDSNPVTQPGMYANWNGGEPNGYNGGESFLQIYFGNDGKWNDLSDGNSLGYIVEYGGMPGEPCVSVTANKTVTVILNKFPETTPKLTDVGSCFPIENKVINFSVSDFETPAENLTVTVTGSSNEDVLPLSNITLINNGADKVLSFSTMPEVYGISNVSVNITDEYNASTTATFAVKVGDYDAPLVVVKDISVSLDENGQAIITPSMIDNNSTDNCSIASYQLATEAASSSKIYFSGTNGMIWSANRDGSGSPKIVYDYHNGLSITTIGLDVNLDNGNFYFGSGWERQVNKASIDGTGGISNVPNTDSSGGARHDVELDLTGNKLFYTDSNNGIYSTSIDGTAPVTHIVSGVGIVAMTFDKTNQKLYYVNPNGSIGVVNADGSNANTNLFSANSPRGITMDEASGRLFWVAKDEKKIYTALADASEEPHELYSFAVDNNYVQNGYGIDYDSKTNSLFWTAFGYSNDDTIYTAPANGSGTPKVLFSGDFGYIRGIAAGRNIKGIALNQPVESVTYTAADAGNKTLYLVVTDTKGNVSTTKAKVTVIGNGEPIMVCSDDITQNADSTESFATITPQHPQIEAIEEITKLTWSIAGVTAASSETTGINYLDETHFNIGESTVTYSATNIAGLTSTCSFVVTVTDNQLPVAIAENITIHLDKDGNAVLTPDQINNNSTDNGQITSYQLLTKTPVSPKIYFTGFDSMLWEANRDGSGTPKIVYDYHKGNYSYFESFDVDIENKNNFYLSGMWYDSVYKFPFDGNGTITPVSEFMNGNNWGYPTDIELDAASNTLYFSTYYNGIYSTDVDGTTSPVQIMNANVLGLVLDKTNQKIYFTNPNGSIGVVNVDGSDVNDNLLTANSPKGITMDEATGRLFWVSENEKNVYTALTNGSEESHVLYSFAADNDYISGIGGIDFDANTNMLFWTAKGNANDDTVYTASADGSGTPKVLYFGNFGSIRGIAAGRNIKGESLSQKVNDISYTAVDLGAHTEYLVVTDSDGNESIASAVVTVAEYVQALAMNCPVAVTSNVQSNCEASVVTENPTFENENLLSTLTWTMTGATVAASASEGVNYVGTATFNSGVTTVTYFATDSNGNTIECSYSVTVKDFVYPVAVTKNVTVELNENGQATITPEQIDDQSADNCQIVSYQLINYATLSPYIYFTGVTDGKVWRANRDGSGTPVMLNASSVGAAGIEVNYDNGKLYYATSTTDNLQEELLTGLGSSITVPNTDLGNNKHDFEYDWTGNRIFYSGNNGGVYVTALDGSGTPTQLVSDAQVTSLTFDKTHQKVYYINLAGGIGVINADGTSKNNVLFTAYNPKGITIDEATGRIFWVEQTLKQIYTALVDGSETPHALYSTGTGSPFGIDFDATTNSLYWTVFNSGEKVVTAPANGTGTPKTLFSGSFGGLRGIAAGRNIKGVDLSSAVNSLTFDCSKIGVNQVALLVTDAQGNKAFKSATVTVKDATLPTITAPQALIVNANEGCIATGVILGTPEMADNCTVFLVGNDAPESFTIGETTVTWTVTDAGENTATALQIVTVKDEVAPAVITQNITVYLNEAGNATITPDQIDNGSTDNCGVENMSLDKTAFTCDDVTNLAEFGKACKGCGAPGTLVALTVTDVNGNASTAYARVIVMDAISPTITAPQALTVNANEGCTATGVTLGTPEMADNCTVFLVGNDAPESFTIGETTVTWTVTDAGGNTATALQIVTVNVLLPVVTTPVVYCQGTEASALTATGSNLLWYTSETEGEGYEGAPMPSTAKSETVSYWVSQTINGCESPRVQVDVVVNSLDVIITNDSGNLSVAEEGAEYQWMTCDGSNYTVIEEATSQDYIPATSGSYAVDVIKNGCTIRSECFEVTALAISHLDGENTVKLYPNPTKNNVTIELTSFDDTELDVYDVRGRLLLSKDLNNAINILDMSGLPTGVYMFRISTESETVIKRVIKQ